MAEQNLIAELLTRLAKLEEALSNPIPGLQPIPLRVAAAEKAVSQAAISQEAAEAEASDELPADDEPVDASSGHPLVGVAKVPWELLPFELPKIPDRTKNYALCYTAAAGKVLWVELTECP